VKICGITSTADAVVAADAGADFIGVILDIEYSPRSVTAAVAKEIVGAIPVPVILLMEKGFKDMASAALEINPYGVQVVGEGTFEETAWLKNTTGCFVLKTVHISRGNTGQDSFSDMYQRIENFGSAGVDAIVLDSKTGKKRGGTGCVCDWDMASRLSASCSVPVILAGGITPENVIQAVETVCPYGIDMSSGVERSPGRKDPEKILKLICNIRRCALN